MGMWKPKSTLISGLALQHSSCKGERDLLVRTNTISVMIDRHSLILPVEMSIVPVPAVLARLCSTSAVMVLMSHQQ